MSDPRGRTGTCRTQAVQSACAEDHYHQSHGDVLRSQVDLVPVEALHGKQQLPSVDHSFCISCNSVRKQVRSYKISKGKGHKKFKFGSVPARRRIKELSLETVRG